MTSQEHFWRLEDLSDRQLLERLQGVLRAQRCALAELIAHLGEVEERRLHLAAAYGSMFSYCVQYLGMSEDEACRRIELARLARRFPLLFGELATGRLSLSVALLLKPVLTPDNHAELIAAVRGASLRAARELLAARFPSPDVPSRIRKLPERGVAPAIPAPRNGVACAIPEPRADAARVTIPNATSDATTAPALISSPTLPRSPEAELGAPESIHAGSLLQNSPTPSEPSHPLAPPGLPRHAQPRQRVDPLSAERYRIQFTSDASLKQKLELARDLLRHSNPGGDLAPIISRALDLLLQELLQRRFGARRKDTPHRAARPAPRSASTAAASTAAASVTLQSSTLPRTMSAPATPEAAPPVAPTLANNPPTVIPSAAAPSASQRDSTSAAATPTSSIARAARRTVLERDGLGCCWVDRTGKRCGSTAWLELDHDHPAGKGGSSEPENLRLLCRAHNRFAAERAYGRAHVDRAIQARQDGVKRRRPSGPPPSSSPAPA